MSINCLILLQVCKPICSAIFPLILLSKNISLSKHIVVLISWRFNKLTLDNVDAICISKYIWIRKKDVFASTNVIFMFNFLGGFSPHECFMLIEALCESAFWMLWVMYCIHMIITSWWIESYLFTILRFNYYFLNIYWIGSFKLSMCSSTLFENYFGIRVICKVTWSGGENGQFWQNRASNT